MEGNTEDEAWGWRIALNQRQTLSILHYFLWQTTGWRNDAKQNAGENATVSALNEGTLADDTPARYSLRIFCTVAC